MIRQAKEQDAAAIEAFLSQHAETSMFLRGNLAAHGTQEQTHRHGTQFFIHTPEGSDLVTAVAGITNLGFLMCQAPTGPDVFFAQVAGALAGRHIAGMTGDPAQVSAMLRAVGCDECAFHLREVEPLYGLDLAALVHVPSAACLRDPVGADVEWLADWFIGFNHDTGIAEISHDTGTKVADTFVGKSDSALLYFEGVPVAMAAINARAGTTVQVGGVYVPPAQRGKGYGGEVLRQLLCRLRGQGVTRAILFAANEPAARAYENIGFTRTGSYELALLKEVYEVPA